MNAITISRSDDGTVVTVTLAGELDISNVAATAGRIDGAIAEGSLAVVLDLTELRYLDSSGVSALFDLARRLKAATRPFCIVVPPGAPIRRLLEVTNLIGSVPVAASIGDVMNGLREDLARG